MLDESLTKVYLYSGALVSIILAYLVYLLVGLLRETRKLNQIFDQFPAEPKHWLYGHMHLIADTGDQLAGYLLDQVVKFPRVTHFWAGPFTPILRIHHPDTVRDVIHTPDPKTTLVTKIFYPIAGEGLSTSCGEKWFRNRRLITPAFHLDILKDHQLVMNEATEVFLDILKATCETGESIEIFRCLNLCAFDIILRCAFTYQTGCQTSKEPHPYVVAVEHMLELTIKRYLKPWLHSNAIYKLTSDGRDFYKICAYVNSVADEVIAERRKMLEKHGEQVMKKGKRQDFIDILLTAKDENGVGLTNLELREEAATFMFTGHETTGSNMTWFVYALAQHPEHQRKCQEEIDHLLEGRESDWIDWEDLDKLQYLTMCIKEMIRLYNPILSIHRSMEKEVTVDGKHLPAGITVEIPLHSLHHNPGIWGEDHMEYQPERFLPENAEKRDPFAFIPFSAGPRNCIGQVFAMAEMKTVLSRMLYRYTFKLDSTRPVKRFRGFVLKPADGMYVHLEPRRLK